MSLTGPLVLAEGVEIIKVADLPSRLRDAIPHDPDDFAVSRAFAREPTRIVDGPGRDLLRHFERPTRIADAVLRFAGEREADAEATLEASYEMLARLYRAGVLVPEERTAAPASLSGWRPREARLGLTLGTLVHALPDTEVFFAHDEAQRPVAVKILRDGRARADREASLLARASPLAPEVHAVHEFDGKGAVVSAWVFGDDLRRAARGLREAGDAPRRLALVTRVASAYAELHERAVLHGDVHPGNVLVEASGAVRLIDFGQAMPLGPEAGALAEVGRGGIAFYMEPEHAEAVARGHSHPLTAAGEQYAVAAMLYEAWTGAHLRDFSLVREILLEQVRALPPLPFADRGVAPWPALEAVFARALAKDPRDRFPSCRALHRALEELASEAPRMTSHPSRRGPSPLEARTRAFLERCGPGGGAFREGLPLGPTASLCFGAAGVGYALYRLALARSDAVLLGAADAWAHRAASLVEADGAFYAGASKITRDDVGRASLLHGEPGVHLVRTLVALASGDPLAAQDGARRFVAASRVPTDLLDAVSGPAGLLLACAEILELARGHASFDPREVLARGAELESAVRDVVFEAPIGHNPRVPWLGMAHGWAGLLFAFLRWSRCTDSSEGEVGEKLEELAALVEPHGRGARWPVTGPGTGRPGYMDGWCNGAAGHALLWAAAFERLREPRYAGLAARAALSAVSSETRVGTLCCGHAGIGYACAAAYRVTGDGAWLDRAHRAAALAARDEDGAYRDALFKGPLGAVVLGAELEAGSAATPLFEPRVLAPR